MSLIGKDVIVYHPESESFPLVGKVVGLDDENNLIIEGEVSGLFDYTMALECALVSQDDDEYKALVKEYKLLKALFLTEYNFDV